MKTTQLPSCRFGLMLGSLLFISGCSTTAQQDEHRYAAVNSTDQHASSMECPPDRQTPQAPQSYYLKENPLPATAAHIGQGKWLYEKGAEPVACANCHGLKGDGQGPIGKHLYPPATDFTCKELMDAIPDGQLFWIIENGSGMFEIPVGHGRESIKRPGRRPRYTAMRGHQTYLNEEQTWQLIHYLRTFAK